LDVARDKLADNGKGVVGMFGPLAEVLAFSSLTRPSSHEVTAGFPLKLFTLLVSV
jgi:hypothetical protein